MLLLNIITSLIICCQLVPQENELSTQLTSLMTQFFKCIPEGLDGEDRLYLVEYEKDIIGDTGSGENFDCLRISSLEKANIKYKYKTYRLVDGKKVFFYGERNSFFQFNALVRDKNDKLSKSADSLECIDPSNYNWEIILFKDGSINEFLTHTNIVTSVRDSVVDIISSILPKPDSLVVEKWLSDYTFGCSDKDFVILEEPASPLPNENKVRLIVQKYSIKRIKGYSAISGVFLIDEKGNARFLSLSGDAGENTDAFTQICNEVEKSVTFSPAKHRGKTVMSYYSLQFYFFD